MAELILGSSDVPAVVAALEGYLAALRPEPDPVVERVRDLVAQAEDDRGLTRAEALAARGTMSLRSLQRLFTDYVGIGPKWVISGSASSTRPPPRTEGSPWTGRCWRPSSGSPTRPT